MTAAAVPDQNAGASSAASDPPVGDSPLRSFAYSLTQFARGRHLGTCIATAPVMCAAAYYLLIDSMDLNENLEIKVIELVSITGGAVAILALFPLTPSFEISATVRVRRWGTAALFTVFSAVVLLNPLTIKLAQIWTLDKQLGVDEVAPFSRMSPATNAVTVLAILVAAVTRWGKLRGVVVMVASYVALIALANQYRWFPFGVVRTLESKPGDAHLIVGAISIAGACWIWYRTGGTSWTAIKDNRVN